jgi:hypothetical protein
MQMKNKPVILILFILAFVPVLYLPGQEAYLPDSGNGAGFAVRSFWKDFAFIDAGLSVGYTIAGILDLGTDLRVGTGDGADAQATTLAVSPRCGLRILRQAEGAPFTFAVGMGYGWLSVSSPSLTTGNLVKKGTLFSADAEICWDAPVSPSLSLRLGAVGRYGLSRYATDRTSYPLGGEPGYPIQERVQEFSYGCELGIRVKTAEGLLTSMTMLALMDRSFRLSLGGSFGVALGPSHFFAPARMK